MFVDVALLVHGCVSRSIQIMVVTPSGNNRKVQRLHGRWWGERVSTSDHFSRSTVSDVFWPRLSSKISALAADDEQRQILRKPCTWVVKGPSPDAPYWKYYVPSGPDKLHPNHDRENEKKRERGGAKDIRRSSQISRRVRWRAQIRIQRHGWQ